MKIPFEDFDEELEENADQELSFAEKAVMKVAAALIKMVLWKVKRARTYGDLYKIANFLKKRFEAEEKRLEGKFTDMDDLGEAVDEVIRTGEDITAEVDKAF
jgi:hypothetical protein